jgi:hypothetical protein
MIRHQTNGGAQPSLSAAMKKGEVAILISRAVF